MLTYKRYRLEYVIEIDAENVETAVATATRHLEETISKGYGHGPFTVTEYVPRRFPIKPKKDMAWRIGDPIYAHGPLSIEEMLAVCITQKIKDEGVHPYAINDGGCEKFASEVVVNIRDICHFPDDLITTLGPYSFATDGVFDPDVIERISPKSAPPDRMTWEDLSKMGIADIAHEWVCLNGRHYDAEVPEGVDSFVAIPIIRRAIAEKLQTVTGGLPSLLYTDWMRESISKLHLYNYWKND